MTEMTVCARIEKETKMNYYDKRVIPNKNKIKQHLQNGVTEEATAKSIGLSYSAWRKYKREYQEFADLIEEAKAIGEEPLVSALYRTATGGAEKITTITDADGNETVKKEVLPPNVDALKFILTNRDPERWKMRQDTKTEVTVTKKLEDF